MLLPPLRLQALRARRRRRTPQAATPRHAPEARRTAPALPPSHLRPCPDATLREPGTLLDHRPLPAAGAAAHPAHHRRDGAPPGEQSGENCICFNYFENGTLVSTKYRSALKHFMMVKGAELIPYNVDSILRHPGCIITEGEFDTAAVIAAGRKDVVSVPAGAPEQPHVAGPLRGVALRRQAGHLHRRRRGTRQGSRSGRNSRAASGWNAAASCTSARLQGCQRASGEIRRRKPPHLHRASRRSAPGRHLHRRRLPRRPALPLRERPAAGCRHRLGQLRRTLHLRAPPPAGDDRTPRRRQVRFTDELVLRLCLRHEWKIAFFSPENMPIAYHLHKLAEKLTGHRFTPDRA